MTDSRDREEILHFTADGSQILDVQGKKQISIVGDFGTPAGTLTEYQSTSQGRGLQQRVIVAVDGYEDHNQRVEFELVGATAPDLYVIATPIPERSDR